MSWRQRRKRPTADVTTYASGVVIECSSPACRGVLLPGDAVGDVCGPCARTRERRRARGLDPLASEEPSSQNTTEQETTT